MEEKYTWAGIVGVIGMLLGFGGSALLDVNIIDNSYICNVNEKLGVFEGSVSHPTSLSSTLASGYWTDVDGNGRRSSCSGGQWIELEIYAAAKGVDPQTFTQQVNVEPEVITEIKFVEIVTKDNSVPIVYTADGRKYFCDGYGANANCVEDDDLLFPFG